MIHHVRLELARCHDFPDGSPDRGYDLSLPLTSEGQLDADSWVHHRDETTFTRFWNGLEDQGRIKHGRHGWSLVFETGPDQDEIIFRGDQHRFAKGEYISIQERDGLMRTFRVADVR